MITSQRVSTLKIRQIPVLVKLVEKWVELLCEASAGKSEINVCPLFSFKNAERTERL